jgi:hypothetical protein
VSAFKDRFCLSADANPRAESTLAREIFARSAT